MSRLEATARNALNALETSHFELVLMDEQMPIMGGLEAVARIREKEKGTGQHLPIVALTANAMKGDRERCLESGMDGYVGKPFQEEELLAVIAAAMNASRRSGPAEAAAERIDERSTSMHTMDAEKAFQRELAGMFLEICPKSLSEIRAAVADRNGPALKFAAHTLKGSAGIFKDKEAVAAAAQMEKVGQNADWEHAEDAGVDLAATMGQLTEALMDFTTSTADREFSKSRN